MNRDLFDISLEVPISHRTATTWIPLWDELWLELSAQQKQKLLTKVEFSPCCRCGVARLVADTRGLYAAVVDIDVARWVRAGECPSRKINTRKRNELIDILPGCPLTIDEIVDKVMSQPTLELQQGCLLKMEQDGWVRLKGRK